MVQGENGCTTGHEVDVLVNWFACESKDMVARKLGLSVRTVNGYVDRVRPRHTQRVPVLAVGAFSGRGRRG